MRQRSDRFGPGMSVEDAVDRLDRTDVVARLHPARRSPRVAPASPPGPYVTLWGPTGPRGVVRAGCDLTAEREAQPIGRQSLPQSPAGTTPTAEDARCSTA